MKNILLTLVFTSISFAGIHYNKNSDDFINKKGHGHTHSSQFTDGSIQSATLTTWPDGFIYGIDAKAPRDQKSLVAMVQSACPTSKYTYTNLPQINTFTAEINTAPASTSIPLADSSKFFAMLQKNLISKVPSTYGLEYHTIIQFIRNDSIAGAVIKFRRVMDNGLFLDNSNYLDVQVNSAGAILKVESKWINYLKSPEKYDMLTIAEAKPMLESTLLNQYDIALIGTMDTVSIVNYSILGVANSWKTVEFKGNEILSPAYSFNVEFTRQDGLKLVKSVIIPILKPLYEVGIQ